MPSKRAIREVESSESGRLYVVATPIGNLGDITLRALEVLRTVDLIAAEDTRHTLKLLSHFEIRKPLVSYHSHNLELRGQQLIQRIRAGESIALVTDAGTPGISDPGSLLIHDALENDLPVTVIPGPVALIVALVASGLPTHPFAFLGFPPSRGSGRRRFFSAHAGLPMTAILYEAPQRLDHTLSDILQYWGNRRIAVARELTKHYEEVFRGTVEEAKEHFSEGTRGELTLVVAGALEEAHDLDHSLHAEIDWREELGRLLDEPCMMTVRDAVNEIVRRFGLQRRTVYQEALKREME